MAKYPISLQNLIHLLKKLPGVGAKTAERYAFRFLDWKEDDLQLLSHHLAALKKEVLLCPVCGCLTSSTECEFCDLSKRDTSTICVVASPKDIYAIEETKAFRGLYHVLGGLISPLDGKLPHHLSFDSLKERICQLVVQEVVIALDSTLEGDATSLYLKEHLSSLPIRISRLAFGLPMGHPFEYADGGTLSRALSGRQQF